MLLRGWFVSPRIIQRLGSEGIPGPERTRFGLPLAHGVAYAKSCAIATLVPELAARTVNAAASAAPGILR